MDLWGRLSNPPEAAEVVAGQGLPGNNQVRQNGAAAPPDPTDAPDQGPREEKGRLSNPTQRRLSPADINDLIAAYRAGATINELAARYRIHRTTVAGHLDQHQIPRHRQRTAWDDKTLREAAELYATGVSLADVAASYGIDAQTVANRFRRGGISVRPRRGWSSRRDAQRDPG